MGSGTTDTSENPLTAIAQAFLDEKSYPYEPVPGVYALYQRGVLKYIGQSGDCAVRLGEHRRRNGGLDAKDEWESGVEFTAQVLPEKDAKQRTRMERFLIFALDPPCNDR